MKENKDSFNLKLSDRLPVHKPESAAWENIASALTGLEAQDAHSPGLLIFSHSPDERPGLAILLQMRMRALSRVATYTTLAAAASLLLLFGILRLTDQSTPSNQQTAQVKNSQGKQNSSEIASTNSSIQSPAAIQSAVRNDAGIAPSKMRRVQTPVNNDNSSANEISNQDNVQVLAQLSQHSENMNPASPKNLPGTAKLRMRVKAGSYSTGNAVAVNKSVSVPISDKHYYSPDPYNPNENKGSNFSLAANYLPETLDNGNGTSMFHNFGLMASLGNEKTRVQSTIGMAYNSEHRVYDVSYTQFIAITVPKPGTNSDSTALMASDRAQELEGTERHQYLTYDLGVGRKLFSVGNMTTWFNTGAGLAFRLDNTSLKEATIKTITGNTNSQINGIDLQIPDYNGVNINLMAGLDINYRILD
ncbi:MAG: hypothetical protein IPH88_19705 [Bacteroidales bacterium]|nr:hypothetical protein [Bacteroidales bacterium]